LEFDDLSHRVIGCALEVHRRLGPGLLESAYEKCLAHELSCRDIPFVTQHELPLEYKGIQIESGYRIDVLVDDCLVIELKTVDELKPIHHAQILTYMRLSEVETGLLINFNVERLKDGLKRFVL